MLIRESSDLDISTEDDLDLDHENFLDVEKHSHSVFHSQISIDRRLANSYQVKRWAESYSHHKNKTAAFKTIQEERNRMQVDNDLEYSQLGG